jgi:hypothetical protein
MGFYDRVGDGGTPPHRTPQEWHGGDQSICTKPLNVRDAGKDGLFPAALLGELAHQVCTRYRCFRFIIQPDLQVVDPPRGEHLVAIDLAQGNEVPAACHLCLCIPSQVIGQDAGLRGDKLRHL